MSKFLLLLLFVSFVHSTYKEYIPRNGEDINSFEFLDGEELEITTRVGHYFTVKIGGNPSTGYNWYLENAKNLILSTPEDLNSRFGTIHYEAEDQSSLLRGAGGHYYFRFLAKKHGEENLIFSKKRGRFVSAKHTIKVNIN